MTTYIARASIDRASFGTDWETWHATHETNRADPHGLLAITGLHFLTGVAQRLTDTPGSWTDTPTGPVVDLTDTEQLTIDGETVTGIRFEFGDIAERDGRLATAGDAVIEVARRGGHIVVRPRHPDNAYLGAYPGTPTYPPNPRWRVAARFQAFIEPREVTVGASVEGLQHVYEAPGQLEFDYRGETFTLTAFNGHTPGALFVLFTDATSGITTYAANRSVSVAAPDADGLTTIDFNRATNLPCAYTDYATCPLPPTENRLPIGIEAGEKTPLTRNTASL